MRSAANRLFCLALLLMVVPVAACGTPVIRSLSTAEPGAGEVFTVSLAVEGMTLGGVVETLPDGYTFAGTDHPDDRVLVRGQRVQAPASGSGDIIGTWEDFIAESHGEIPPSRVAVDGIDVPGAGDPSPADARAGSPCTALIAVAGLLLVAYRGGRR
jgi:hypothetical protein